MKKILAYHSIGDRTAEAGAGLYCVGEKRFREQMEYVRNKGTVPFGDSPLISFDDGDITNYTKAYPVLKGFGLKAHFFIIGEWVGKTGYMDWREIRELKDAGMIIGSHGMTHRVLTTLEDKELEYEFTFSKKLIEGNLETGVETVSLPRGLYDKKVVGKAMEAGYKKIFTSDLTGPGAFLSGRIAVRADWDIEHFRRAIEKGPSLGENAGEFIKRTSRKIFGDAGYDRVRTRILRWL